MAPRRNPWKEAVIDAAVVDWVYTADMEDDPRKAINSLCCQAARIALDPVVSDEAKKLQIDAMLAERLRCLRLVGAFRDKHNRYADDAEVRGDNEDRSYELTRAHAYEVLARAISEGPTI